MADPVPSDKRGGHFFRFCAWSSSGLILLALTLALGLAVLAGNRVSAPEWLRDRVLEEINTRLDIASVEAGDVSVRLDQGLIPHLGLRDVVVRDTSGERLVQFDDMQSAVSLSALLQGALEPVSIEVSGVQFRLRRFETGSVGLTLEAGAGDADREAEYQGVQLGMHGALAEVDAWLGHPNLRALEQVSVGNVTLRYEDARVGRVWTADGARLSLTRTGDDLRLRGDAALLSGGANATAIEMNFSKRLGETRSELGVSFQDMPARDIAGQTAGLAWLSAIDAPISGALRAEVDETGALGPLNATLQIGAGALRPAGEARPIGFNSARTYFTYRPGEQNIEFSEIYVDSDWVLVDASGSAVLTGMETGWPDALDLKFEISNIVTNPLGLYPEPIGLERARLDMTLALDPLHLDLHGLQIFDLDEVLTVNGEASAQAQGWQIAVAGDIARIAPERLMELWPASLAPKARLWIDTNVTRTELSNIRFHIEAPAGQVPSAFLGFDFSDFNARFMRDVPPIEAAFGQASLQGKRFVIAAKGGHITAGQGGRIDIAGTQFVIPNTGIKRTPAEVHLVAAGPITAALSFLDTRPFGYISRAGLPIDLAEGRAEVAGRLDFRMADDLDVRDVKFELAGGLSDVVTDRLMPGRVLQAPQLALNVTHDGLELAGSGQVGDVPFEGRYDMRFSPDQDPESAMGQVRGKVEISDRFIDEFGIVLPPGTFQGEGHADLEIDLARDVPARLRLQSDLAGIALRIDPLNWQKPADVTGLLQVTGRLGAPPEIDLIEIEASGLSASGALSLRADGTLELAAFDRLTVGDWLDVPVELVGRGRGIPPLIRVRGGEVDLSRAQLGQNGGGGEGGPVSLQLDRLVITDTLVLNGFRAEIAPGRGASGPFSGALNGLAPITGQMIAQDGRSAFQIRSENAGAFFAATGLIRQARNGAVDLSIVPGAQEGVWEGTLTARGGMRLKDAPTMAALLNAVTVVGLLEQLGGEGIH
ncbi:MAG: DUF3971 domain-containing protein, partial [Pseudomonadota bacterium]